MIKITDHKISHTELLQLCRAHFDTMVKFVVDLDSHKVALGGEMYADAEALLLQDGSDQSSLWGGNLYPWNDPEQRIEYTSFINIRPMDDNTSMEIQDDLIKKSVKTLTETCILGSDELLEGA
ncbi:MAG: DUF5674 family protein [candidate division KSB1 bacterium]|nr:DUF5674 family protein [candidate division KSB1 bacterium]